MLPIVRYQFGNQITRSEIEIFPDGRVRHLEKRGGGRPPEEVPEPPLTAVQLRALKRQIASAQRVEPVAADGGATTMGSSSGDLFVRAGESEATVIRSISRSPTRRGNDRVVYNPSEAASAIERLVLGYTDVDMPARARRRAPV